MDGITSSVSAIDLIFKGIRLEGFWVGRLVTTQVHIHFLSFHFIFFHFLVLFFLRLLCLLIDLFDLST